YSGSNFNLINNILSNIGGGYSIYTTHTGTFNASDHNNLFTTGQVLGYWNGNQANLAAWNTASGKDANSLSIDPLYTSNTDLHVREITLNLAGTPVVGVADDIDNEPRDPVTPDIGADEFVPPAPDDAGVVSIDAPFVPFAVGNQNVMVSVRNYGSATLTSVTVQWKLNGTLQTAYNWLGTIATGAVSSINIGNSSFNLGTAYNIEAWTVNPNGVVDTLNYNDTSKIGNLYAALSGNYTIGGALPDFTNFSVPANILNYGGITGPVIFDVRSGTYQEQLNLREITGSSATNSIIFRSETGDSSDVTITYSAGSSNNYTVQLDGSDYVTFTKMTIEATGGSYARVIDVRNGATNCTFTNNRLIGISSAGTYDSRALFYSPSGFLDGNCTIGNNYFEDGSYGVLLLGGGSTSLESGNTIHNNTFDDQYYCAVRLYYQDAPSITSNTITPTTYSNFRSIEVSYCNNALEIAKNTITGGVGAYGILMSNCNGGGNRGLIANNFIQIGGSSSAYGIYIQQSSLQNIYFNSVNITSSNANYGRALYISSSGNANLNLLNNIFANTGGGYASYIDQSTAVSNSNYNDLYTTGANLGYWLGNQADLSAWQATSGFDGNSFEVDPLFYTSNNLHISQSILDSAAISVIGITDDIDGETRSAAFPDIGADEFDNFNYDVGIIGLVSPVSECDLSPSENVTVTIQNFGALPQTGFDVAFSLNGGAPVVENV
ncbi:MAG TPA: right-handed parallel beta-helix repeat-containing protein, partial [Flavobacteriales bacterium]|nr:right-handed parallel beta-helix repeat-containing protein [Flavobacteriales bacterium]